MLDRNHARQMLSFQAANKSAKQHTRLVQTNTSISSDPQFHGGWNSSGFNNAFVHHLAGAESHDSVQANTHIAFRFIFHLCLSCLDYHTICHFDIFPLDDSALILIFFLQATGLLAHDIYFCFNEAKFVPGGGRARR